MTQNPYSGNSPVRPQRKLWRVIVPIILTGLVVLGVRLAINAQNYTNQTNQIIASMEPTQSVYNTKLKTAVDADQLVLDRATRVLSDAQYLSATLDYLKLDSAVTDARTALDLSGSYQLGTLTKEDYETAMADIDASFAELQTAQSAIAADMAATPSPAPAGAATPAPAS